MLLVCRSVFSNTYSCLPLQLCSKKTAHFGSNVEGRINRCWFFFFFHLDLIGLNVSFSSSSNWENEVCFIYDIGMRYVLLQHSKKVKSLAFFLFIFVMAKLIIAYLQVFCFSQREFLGIFLYSVCSYEEMFA